jgi:hypothetical protein
LAKTVLKHHTVFFFVAHLVNLTSQWWTKNDLGWSLLVAAGSTAGDCFGFRF